MGLEQVKSEILEEAREEADEIISEAEEKAEEIVSEAEEKADKIREETEHEIEERKESIRRKALSNARMKAKQRRESARQDSIDDAFNQFRNELSTLDEDDRESFVQSCVDKVEFDIGEIKGSEDFEDAISEEDFDFHEIQDSGIVIVSENGERRQDFRFSRLLENFRQNHRKEVASTLFRGE